MVEVSQNIIYDIRKDLFEHLQKLPFQYYDDRPHGKILIRVVNYVNSVSDMLSNGLINIVLESFNLLFIVIFMFLVDVQLALCLLYTSDKICGGSVIVLTSSGESAVNSKGVSGDGHGTVPCGITNFRISCQAPH